jgi:hypothetical protein
MSNFSHVEIDDADTESTHLWVFVVDTDNETRFIEQFKIRERNRAYHLASQLAGLLEIPIKLKKSPELEAELITDPAFPSTA